MLQIIRSLKLSLGRKGAIAISKGVTTITKGVTIIMKGVTTSRALEKISLAWK